MKSKGSGGSSSGFPAIAWYIIPMSAPVAVNGYAYPLSYFPIDAQPANSGIKSSIGTIWRLGDTVTVLIVSKWESDGLALQTVTRIFFHEIIKKTEELVIHLLVVVGTQFVRLLHKSVAF